MAKSTLTVSLTVALAEIVASWNVWGAAPTDTIRVSYPGFWGYEVGRLSCWAPVFVIGLIVWLTAWRALGLRALTRAKGLWRALLIGMALASGLEIGTSILYWKSLASLPLRGLYESSWYWRHAPSPGEQGWPSLEGYAYKHALGWAASVLVLGGLWFAGQRLRATRRTRSE